MEVGSPKRTNMQLVSNRKLLMDVLGQGDHWENELGDEVLSGSTTLKNRSQACSWHFVCA